MISKTIDLKFIITLFLAVATGLTIANEAWIALLAIVSMGYLIFAVYNPLYHFYFVVLTSVEFLGYFDPTTYVHVPGLFKLVDLMLVATIVIYIYDLLKNNIFVQASKKGISLQTRKANLLSLKNLLIFMVFLTLFQIIFTAFRFQLSFISCFKAGRMFLFFFIGIFLMDFFKSDDFKLKIIKFILILGSIQSILAILQYFIGSYFFLGYTKITELGIGYETVTRIYQPAFYYTMVSFTLSFWLIYFKNEQIFSQKILYMIFLTTGLSILLSYQRTSWVGAFIGISLPFVMLNWIKSLKYFYFLIAAVLILIPLLYLFAPGQLNKITARAESILDETINYKGNFAIRIEENTKRVDLIKKHYITGPGMVHADDAPSLFYFENTSGRRALLQTNDSGLITFLVSFGMIGVIWTACLLTVLTKILRRSILLKSQKIGYIFGISSFIWATFLTSFTTTGFTFTKGVICLSVMIYLMDWDITDNNRNASAN